MLTCAAEAAVRAPAALMARNRTLPVEMGAVDTMDEVMTTIHRCEPGQLHRPGSVFIS